MKILCKATALALLLAAALTCAVACDDTDAPQETATEKATSSVDNGFPEWPLGDQEIILPEEEITD